MHVGQAIHWVMPNGAHRPGVVLDVRDRQSPAILVFCLPEDKGGGGFLWVDNAVFDDGVRCVDTWHYPEIRDAPTPDEVIALIQEELDAAVARTSKQD